MLSQDDLNSFHARVFGFAAPSTFQIPTEARSYNYQAVDRDEDHNEDGLGYYPDGTKRTLTDDQIAMFRHSEIYAILRKRQIRKENREVDEGGNELADGQHQEIDQAIEATVSPNEEGEVRSSCYVAAENLVPDVDPQSNAAGVPLKNKRKRADEYAGDENGRARTSRSTRRVVRELDWAMAEDQVLDYDDEPSNAVQDDFFHPQALQSGTLSNTAETTPEARSAAVRPLTEGRKFWWPAIG